MFLEPSPDHEFLITAGIEAADEALKKINGRTLVPASEVTDWLLDIRQTLDRYYIERRQIEGEPAS